MVTDKEVATENCIFLNVQHIKPLLKNHVTKHHWQQQRLVALERITVWQAHD